MVRYYLGIQVKVLEGTGSGDGWIWAEWPDGRRFKHWAAQLTEEPWS